MENQNDSNLINSKDDISNVESDSIDLSDPSAVGKNDSKVLGKPLTVSKPKAEENPNVKKPVKPPKIEDKPFEEFISKHFIPGLKSSIEAKGTSVRDIKLIEGERPVVGGNCWIVFCEISEQRKFWLCFNKDIITSDKTILLAESNSDPSIVESFLIDEKKTTLPLLISRVLQRLNGQKWIGVN